jgi:hypothetical protein
LPPPAAFDLQGEKRPAAQEHHTDGAIRAGAGRGVRAVPVACRSTGRVKKLLTAASSPKRSAAANSTATSNRPNPQDAAGKGLSRGQARVSSKSHYPAADGFGPHIERRNACVLRGLSAWSCLRFCAPSLQVPRWFTARPQALRHPQQRQRRRAKWQEPSRPKWSSLVSERSVAKW